MLAGAAVAAACRPSLPFDLSLQALLTLFFKRLPCCCLHEGEGKSSVLKGLGEALGGQVWQQRGSVWLPISRRTLTAVQTPADCTTDLSDRTFQRYLSQPGDQNLGDERRSGFPCSLSKLAHEGARRREKSVEYRAAKKPHKVES